MKENRFTEKQGNILVGLARKSIVEHLGEKIDPSLSEELLIALKKNDFSAKCGTFVTLHCDNLLRGCIGSLTANSSVIESIKSNAISAAFHDPRFPPVSSNELDILDVEVSILSPPQTLDYDDSSDLLHKLRPYVDGVIVRKDMASATFLPQVWEQLPKPEDFLSRLCQKAGLQGDTWQTKRLDVSTYQVQKFTEK